MKKKQAKANEKASDAADGIESEEDGIVYPDGTRPKKRHFELNLDPEYWKKKFLYPYALDLAPIRLDASKQSPEEIIAEKKRQKLLGDESILNTTKYQFPVNQIKKLEYLHEV